LLGLAHSYEKRYGLGEFSNMLLGNSPNECRQKQNQSDDIKQQLSLVQARISVTTLIYSDKFGIGNSTQSTSDNSTEYYSGR
jgi:hypothetical protein